MALADVDLPLISISLLMAGVFAEALHHKLDSVVRFAATFSAWKLVPESVVPVIARVVITLEAITVLACLFIPRAGVAIAAALLTVYALGMGLNRARGRSFIDCGCGDEPVPLSLALILRNVVLSVLASSALLADPIGPLNWGETLTEIAAATAAIGLYRVTNILIANAARFRLAGYHA
jgi:hypothetical protein